MNFIRTKQFKAVNMENVNTISIAKGTFKNNFTIMADNEELIGGFTYEDDNLYDFLKGRVGTIDEDTTTLIDGIDKNEGYMVLNIKIKMVDM